MISTMGWGADLLLLPGAGDYVDMCDDILSRSFLFPAELQQRSGRQPPI